MVGKVAQKNGRGAGRQEGVFGLAQPRSEDHLEAGAPPAQPSGKSMKPGDLDKFTTRGGAGFSIQSCRVLSFSPFFFSHEAPERE